MNCAAKSRESLPLEAGFGPTQIEPVAADNMVSLYDIMYRLKVGELAIMLTGLQSASKEAAWNDRTGVKKTEAPQQFVNALIRVLDGIQLFEVDLELDSSLKLQIKNLKEGLEKKTTDLRGNALEVHTSSIVSGLLDNLERRLFMFIPAERAGYYRNADLFGQAIYVFPEAIPDMLDAANAYAADLPTACVFHAMRVSEFGLRALAKDLNLTLTDKKTPCPLEYGSWDQIMTAITNKVEAARRLPAGPKKNEKITF